MPSFVQLALDFFAAPLAAAPAKPTPVAASPSPQALPPPQTQPRLAAPRQFAHPRANRQARLDGLVVAYEFKRARRRSVGMTVGPEGLVVRAPRWLPLYEVETALQEKATWIVRKLYEMQQQERKLAAQRIQWRDGARLTFLGDTLSLVLDCSHASPATDPSLKAGEAAVTLRSSLAAPTSPARLSLHIGLPPQAQPEQIRAAVQAWLMRQAHRIFTERLQHYAPLLGVQWRKLTLSNAHTRWGSAGADGAIRLHWQLIHFKLEVIDYVVAHELSHLRVMDHSPRFWDTVRSVMPDYQLYRQQLRDASIAHWS